jgi:MFS family permease
VADLVGNVLVFKWGVVLFALTTFLCAISPSGGILIAMRVFQGFGAAMTMTTGAPILISAFPPSEWGKVLGVNVAAVYLGLAAGPVFGGILTQQWGWRSIFYVASLLGALSVVLSFLKLKDFQPVKNGSKIDLIGTLYYAISLFALVYGSSNLGKSFGWPLLAIGLLFMILFVWQSKRSAYPVFEIALFTKNKLFAFSNIAALINYSATASIVFLMSLFLQKVKGLTPQQAGMILIAQPVIMAIVSPLAGRLSDKIEPRKLASLGMFLNSAGLFLLAFVNENSSEQLIVMILLLMGLGFGIFSSPNMNTIMSSVEKKQLGIASGTAATMRIIGQMVSMTIVMLIFSFMFNGAKISRVANDRFISSAQLAFLIFSAMCLIGVWFSYVRGNLR